MVETPSVCWLVSGPRMLSKSLTLLSKSSCVYNLNGEFTKWEKHNAFDGEAKRERE